MVLGFARSPMLYFSTNRNSPKVTFREAVLKGQPDDRGLYFPEKIPQLSTGFLTNLDQKSQEEIAFEVIRPYVVGSIPDDILGRICAETVNFPFPLVSVSERIYALELFHGPTLAFKDVGARFMSRCLGYFSRGLPTKTIVVAATSGDTGGAVAAGFSAVENVEVLILYPKGKVSRIQELQLTTHTGVTALEVDGSFDDCQALAKAVLGDTELRSKVGLTSANSINVARWLPQQFYYFYALRQWDGEPPTISVPSGNFGNLAAGLTANGSGLPVKKFLAACNANDVVPRFLRTGKYEAAAVKHTLSNAMDVGDPSNFVRVIEILGDRLHFCLEAFSISDKATSETIREVYQKYKYILDPHGAVGYRVLADHLDRHAAEKGIFLETAHPIKFDAVSDILRVAVDVPSSINDLLARKKTKICIGAVYEELKEIVLSLL